MSAFPIVIALGSNVGDSLRHLREATALLRQAVQVERVSSVYRTAPMYVEDQPPFLNAALTATTELGPRCLLRRLKEIEAEIGRQSRSRYGPREIDLDLIAYGSLSYTFGGGDKPLVVPHPKTAERRFVLAPLFEIDPGYKLVGLGTVSELLAQTNDQAKDVEKLDHANL
ncbi:MAG TPA: 2-amino-4-hydroxy-6-hydroxymethyldihydropteridine diphosphokinase [Fimbriimonadaceae bacterium]|nr:2-amino-4-hydroxy-6-hydroxymethyldihydropteridine diphosphokinase [Fimbriimonadaceae bacterium]